MKEELRSPGAANQYNCRLLAYLIFTTCAAIEPKDSSHMPELILLDAVQTHESLARGLHNLIVSKTTQPETPLYNLPGP